MFDTLMVRHFSTATDVSAAWMIESLSCYDVSHLTVLRLAGERWMALPSLRYGRMNPGVCVHNNRWEPHPRYRYSFSTWLRICDNAPGSILADCMCWA